MSKKQAIILLFSAILIGFLMIQPFNYLCRLTGKCTPIILSYYLPKSVGKGRYEVFFVTKNRAKEVKFVADSRSEIVNAGANASMIYRVKNISDHDITIRPMPYVIPEEANNHIKFYECLCFSEHKIKAGDTIKMAVRFNLDRAIEKDPLFKENRIIVVGYEIEKL